MLFTGEIRWFAGGSVPQNWLPCDGREVGRLDYPELFALIGVSYGDGDASTTFNVPDMQGRTVVGVSPGDIDADRADIRLFGDVGGSESTATVATSTVTTDPTLNSVPYVTLLPCIYART